MVANKIHDVVKKSRVVMSIQGHHSTVNDAQYLNICIMQPK